jgi:hypothetical protein
VGHNSKVKGHNSKQQEHTVRLHYNRLDALLFVLTRYTLGLNRLIVQFLMMYWDGLSTDVAWEKGFSLVVRE